MIQTLLVLVTEKNNVFPLHLLVSFPITLKHLLASLLVVFCLVSAFHFPNELKLRLCSYNAANSFLVNVK